MKVKKIIDDLKFPQLMGSDGEGGDGGDGDGDLDNRIGSTSGGANDDDDDDDDEDEDTSDDDEGKRKLSREAAKRRRENNKLKKANEELQAKIAEQELSRKTKLEQAQHRLQEAEQKTDNLAETNQKLLLEMAILKDSKRTWHDSSAVIALLDTSEVEIDPESGNIEGVEEALADLAKDKPFLLKTAGSRQGNGSSGSQPNAGSGGNKQTEEQRKRELGKKWKLG